MGASGFLLSGLVRVDGGRPRVGTNLDASESAPLGRVPTFAPPLEKVPPRLGKRSSSISYTNKIIVPLLSSLSSL